MERKYVLTRIQAGDYIFPSNDAESLLRVSSYFEDGSATVSADGVNWKPLRGTFWSAYRFDGPLEDAQRLMDVNPEEFVAWTRWREIATTLNTRAEAIDEALTYRPKVAAMREL